MYRYKGYVVVKNTGASMPFSFEHKNYSLSEQELLNYISSTLNEQIENIKWIQEYKVIKK